MLMRDIVQQLVDAGEDDLGFEQLVDRLKALAAEKGPWLVATPLANVKLAEAFVAINERTALMQPRQEQDWEPWDDGNESRLEANRHFQDWISPRPRWKTALTSALVGQPSDCSATSRPSA
ncbi:MAG: hypothetical protein QOE69_1984 [Thermoleophilaceae bacterium]|nr:hypothetical protein [Thermoleophilaceae bacterium]